MGDAQSNNPHNIGPPVGTSASMIMSTRADSTWSLRQKLGFHDDTLWKQLSTRRLEFIHSMGLNLRKASEQEKEITAVALQLCTEYGYSSDFVGDFEKLVRAGVQSVRRNQRRPTKAKSHTDHSSPALSSDSLLTHRPSNSLPDISVPPFASIDSQLPSPDLRANNRQGSYTSLRSLDISSAATPLMSSYPISSAPSSLHLDGLSNIAGTAASSPGPGSGRESSGAEGVTGLRFSPGRSLENQKEVPVGGDQISGALVELENLVKSARSRGLEAPEPAVATLTAAGALRMAVGMAAATNSSQKVASTSIIASLECGVLGSAISEIVDPSPKNTSTTNPCGTGPLARVIALIVLHDPTTSTGVLQNLMSGLLCLEDSSVRGIFDVLAHLRGPLNTRPPTNSHSGYSLPVSERRPPFAAGISPVDELNKKAMAHGSVLPKMESRQLPVAGVLDVRNVTLRHGSSFHEFTYSPINNTPPTLGELLDTGRSMFNFPPNAIIRVRDLVRGIIVETNTELAEAFLLLRVDLELFVPPPPMLPRISMGSTRFAPVAPDLRRL